MLRCTHPRGAVKKHLRPYTKGRAFLNYPLPVYYTMLYYIILLILLLYCSGERNEASPSKCKRKQKQGGGVAALKKNYTHRQHVNTFITI